MKHFLLRLALALAAAWVILIAGWSVHYTEKLLRPACIRADFSSPPNFKSITLITPEGLALSGWWLPPKNGAVILLLGGLGSSRDTLLPEAQILAEAGYGVLTLDSRACAGALGTLGYAETAELSAMLDYAQHQVGVEWVGVLGFSVGGTTALLGSAQFPELRAVVAEGNFANLQDEITYTPARVLSPQWQAQHLVLLVYRLRTGLSPRVVSPVDALPQIAPRPVFLIHGDRELARTHGQDQANAGPSAVLWIVPNAGHGEYRAADPDEYARRITSFFDAARNSSGSFGGP